jgi:hypothetical protein
MAAFLSTHSIYVIDLPLLVVLISLVYSATRYDEWSAIFHEAFRWGIRLVTFLGFITVVLYLVNSFNLMLFLLCVAGGVIALILYAVTGFPTREGT